MLKYQLDYRNDALKLDKLDIETVFEKNKFITFFYIIPRPFFPAVKRMSKVLILPKTHSTKNLGRKYSLYNALVCWFGLPFGPMNMLSCNKINQLGLDISEELKGKVTISDLKQGFFQLPLYHGEFTEITKAVSKEFVKMIEKSNPKNIDLNSILAYVKNSGKHYFYLGIRAGDDFGPISTDIKKYFKDNFDNRALLEIVQLEVENDIQEQLIKKGKEL